MSGGAEFSCFPCLSETLDKKTIKLLMPASCEFSLGERVRWCASSILYNSISAVRTVYGDSYAPRRSFIQPLIRLSRDGSHVGYGIGRAVNILTHIRKSKASVKYYGR